MMKRLLFFFLLLSSASYGQTRIKLTQMPRIGLDSVYVGGSDGTPTIKHKSYVGGGGGGGEGSTTNSLSVAAPVLMTGSGGFNGSVAKTIYLDSTYFRDRYVRFDGSYPNPSWITSLAYAKLTGAPAPWDSTYGYSKAGINSLLAYKQDAATAVTLTGTQTVTNKTLTSPIISNILGANGTSVFQLVGVSSGVNYLKATNAASGSGPILAVDGAATNVDLTIQAKGSGKVVYQSEVDYQAGASVDGAEITTNTDVQTLTNKTLSNAIVGTQSANDNSTKAASTAYADAKVEDALVDGVTTKASSQNATVDALALKVDKEAYTSVSVATGTYTLSAANKQNPLFQSAMTGASTIALGGVTAGQHGEWVVTVNTTSSVVVTLPAGFTNREDGAVITTRTLQPGLTGRLVTLYWSTTNGTTLDWIFYDGSIQTQLNAKIDNTDIRLTDTRYKKRYYELTAAISFVPGTTAKTVITQHPIPAGFMLEAIPRNIYAFFTTASATNKTVALEIYDGTNTITLGSIVLNSGATSAASFQINLTTNSTFLGIIGGCWINGTNTNLNTAIGLSNSANVWYLRFVTTNATGTDSVVLRSAYME